VHLPHRIARAVLFSDVHLGWAVCSTHHARWLRALPEVVDDAELVVLNGDVVDGHRRIHRAAERDLVDGLTALVVQWRREGRTVVPIEGNHDHGSPGPLAPEHWRLDFLGAGGQRARVLHGHRTSPSSVVWSRYDRLGRRVLAWENRRYARHRALRAAYRFAPGLLVSAIGFVECTLARRRLPRDFAALAANADVLVHGHIHYGPGRGRIGATPTFRTGSWVSPGHLGTADRLLRYRRGRFERVGWSGGRWRTFDDGR